MMAASAMPPQTPPDGKWRIGSNTMNPSFIDNLPSKPAVGFPYLVLQIAARDKVFH
jgi:hypothetical protein